MRQLYFIFIGLTLFGLSASASRIIRPNPADFSQISGFRAEWCASKLCYGRAIFAKLTPVRAILVNGASLYVESEFPRVELLKPRFGVVGPVGALTGAELGQAAVTIDAQGEVDSVTLSSPSLGTLNANRP